MALFSKSGGGSNTVREIQEPHNHTPIEVDTLPVHALDPESYNDAPSLVFLTTDGEQYRKIIPFTGQRLWELVE